MLLKKQKRLWAVCLVFVLLLSTMSGVFMEEANAATTIQLNPSYQHEEFQGWGTALAWFGNVTGGWPDNTRNALADALYSSSGLNFNIARYNIGGGQNPDYLSNMREGGAVPGYQPSRGVWDWNADANQRWWVQAAKARGANLFEAFSNSAPYWMTQSGSSAGHTDSSQTNLKDSEYDNFANYLGEVVKRFNDYWGITFHSLSPVNEPNTNYWGANGAQEGSHWDPQDQASMINKSRAALNARGLTSTKIAAMDESNLSTFMTNWNAYDSNTKANVGQMNTHSYGGSNSNRIAIRDASKAANKDLWMSEVDLGPSGIAHDHNNIEPALALSQRINDDINYLEPRAWVLWQAIESEKNMSASGENMNWGLIHADFDTTAWHYTKKYYGMGNYSKFIRPGYHVINTNNNNTLAAYDSDSSQAVVVYRNNSTSSEALNIDLSGFTTVTGSATPYVTSASDNLSQKSNISISNKTLNATVAAKSITTFVISGVSGVNDGGGTFPDPTKWYKVINRNSGKVADVNGASTANGAAIIQWTDNGGYNQHWRFESLGSGYYRVINRNSGLMWDISGAGTNDGAPNIQWPWNGGYNQQWSLSSSGGYYTIINRNSGKLMDVNSGGTSNGDTVIQWPSNGGTNQQWSIIETP